MEAIRKLLSDFVSAVITALLIAALLIVITGIQNARKDGYWTDRETKIEDLQKELKILKMKERQEKALWEYWKEQQTGSSSAISGLEVSFWKLKYDFAKIQCSMKTAEITNLKAVSVWDYISKTFRESAVTFFLHAFFLVLFFPLLWKLFMYYIVARSVEFIAPVRAKKGDHEKSMTFIDSDVALDYALQPGEKLYLRAGDWGKKRTNLTASTKFFWNWRFPLVSIVANLVELVSYSCAGENEGKITITSPDADLFIGRIRLDGDSGIVIRPGYLVGVTDQIRIRTRWSFNLHNLLSGRVRQIILYGNGTVFVCGSWGVDCLSPEDSQDSRVEDNLTIAYENKSEYSLCRTETFWHYLRGSASLFDLRLRRGAFLTQNNNAADRNYAKNTLERILSGVLNMIGNFLGF